MANRPSVEEVQIGFGKLGSEQRKQAVALALRKLDAVDRRYAGLIAKAQSVGSQTGASVAFISASISFGKNAALHGIWSVAVVSLYFIAVLLAVWAVTCVWRAQRVSRGADIAWRAISNLDGCSDVDVMLIGHFARVEQECEDANQAVAKEVASAQAVLVLFVGVVGAMAGTVLLHEMMSNGTS